MSLQTKITVDNTSGGGSDSPGSSRWWDRPLPEKGDESKKAEREREDVSATVHAEASPYIQTLMAAWERHDWFDRVHDRIYENRALLSYRKARELLEAAGFNPSRLAVTTNIVDTFVSRFTRRRPMPMFVVDGAEWSLKKKAQEFRKLLQGKMMETNVDRLSPACVKDACVRGTGLLYVDEGDDDIVVERSHRWEWFVDPYEAAAGPGAVRQKHRVKRVAREVLQAMYPDQRDVIAKAPPSRRRAHESESEWANPLGSGAHENVIDVYESWHLPSGCDADDGRKAICIEGATLYFDRWEKPRFPVAVLRRHRRQDGYWGQGDVERLAEDQADVNRIARDIQRNAEVHGNLIIFTNEPNDSIPTEKLTGRGPMRIRHRGAQPPIYHVPNPVGPSHLGYLERRISLMYDNSGVAQWSAQGRSPLGNGASGIAIDNMEDLQSDRHAEFEGDYSHWRCDVGHLIIDACQRVAENRKRKAKADGKPSTSYSTTWMKGDTMQRIDWESAAMKEEQYSLQIEPTSYIPSTRAGKLAYAKELMDAGLMQRHHMLALFDEPDIAQHNRIELAAYNRALDVMEILGDDAQEAPMPEPLWDLEVHLVFAKAFYQIAQNDRAPEEIQARYRDYADAVQDLMDQAKPAGDPAIMPPVDPAAMGAPPPMGPPGMPPEMGMGGPPMPMEMPPMAA